MRDFTFECTIDGRGCPTALLEAVRYHRDVHVLHEFDRAGALVAHNGRTLSHEDINYLDAGEAFRTSVAVRRSYDLEGIRTLFDAQLRASDLRWREMNAASGDAPLQPCVADIAITGIAFEEFVESMKAQSPFLEHHAELHPDHYAITRNGGELHGIEVFGMFGGPSEWRLKPDPELCVPIARDGLYPYAFGAVATLADGTISNAPALVQFKPVVDGLLIRAGCCFPAAAPREMVEGHKLHLALEFLGFARVIAGSHREQHRRRNENAHSPDNGRSHGGIGLECSRHLAARYRADLILAGRSLFRIEPVARELAKSYGVTVAPLQLDTSSLSSVRSAAAKCRTWLDDRSAGPLKALICNAGIRLGGKINHSDDGFKETFATNCLGHFLLVELMADRLDGAGRIVYTTSGTHDPGTMEGRMVGAAVEPDALALAHDGKDGRKPLSSGVRYTTSKLGDILYAYESHRRLRCSGSAIASIAYDPGAVPSTGFLRAMPKPVQWLGRTALMPWVMRRMGMPIGSPEFSGAGLAQVALDPAYANSSGRYIQSNNGRLVDARSSKISYDEQVALKFWCDSRRLAGLKADEESVLLRAASVGVS